MTAAIADTPPIDAGLADLAVLIIDDQQKNIDALRRILRLAGFRSVTGETDPRRALEELPGSQPDLIVLDWHMPDLNGQKVLGALRQLADEEDHLPVVVLTADPDRGVREAPVLAGATDFLTRPLDSREVVLRVRNQLGARAAHRRLRSQCAALALEVATRDAEEARLLTRRVDRPIRVADVLEERRCRWCSSRSWTSTAARSSARKLSRGPGAGPARRMVRRARRAPHRDRRSIAG